ncbi:MAG TPA: TetR/AcrR family transcriptional regulator [Pseudonocardia sp.]|jgi:AcrR family transcriptional regulator
MTGAEPLTRRAEREREIIDAAAALFREKGYASTTIRDIGARAGVNHASSHYYFGSKAAILYAIYQEALDGFIDRLDAIPTGRADEMIAAMVRAAVQEAARRPDHSAVFFQERRWLETYLRADQCTEVRRRQARFRARLTETVANGIADGSLRDLDPGIVVETVVGLATWAYQNMPGDLDQAADQCVDFVLGGIRTVREERS